MKREKATTITEILGLKNVKLDDHFDLDGVTVDLTKIEAINELEIGGWEEGAHVIIELTGETELISGNKLGDLLQAIDRKVERRGEEVLSGVCSAIGTPFEERAEGFDLLAMFNCMSSKIVGPFAA